MSKLNRFYESSEKTKQFRLSSPIFVLVVVAAAFFVVVDVVLGFFYA